MDLNANEKGLKIPTFNGKKNKFTVWWHHFLGCSLHLFLFRCRRVGGVAFALSTQIAFNRNPICSLFQIPHRFLALLQQTMTRKVTLGVVATAWLSLSASPSAVAFSAAGGKHPFRRASLLHVGGSYLDSLSGPPSWPAVSTVSK